MNKENVITLDNPVKRGEQVIEQVTLMKPNAGTLRGVSLAAVANSEVDALIKEVTKNDARVRYVCFYAPDAATPDHAARIRLSLAVKFPYR
ncbi:TPA: hypothetical protein ACM6YF_004159 [Escherichia coli]